jgi:hypothetical protein
VGGPSLESLTGHQSNSTAPGTKGKSRQAQPLGNLRSGLTILVSLQ